MPEPLVPVRPGNPACHVLAPDLGRADGAVLRPERAAPVDHIDAPGEEVPIAAE